ncbi:MAG TPA: hypothetical protein VG013_26950 [Gemmataceae bacterium]|jgi:hypothetical protein|nr:hypothetical protein [Gemmataceae bacterium]
MIALKPHVWRPAVLPAVLAGLLAGLALPGCGGPSDTAPASGNNQQPAVQDNQPPAATGWTLNVEQMVMPESPATGVVHGRRFRPDKATLDHGVLTLRQGKDPVPDLAVKVVLFLGSGRPPEGATYRIASVPGLGSPRVNLEWKVAGKTVPEAAMFTGKYAMRLEFGKVNKGRLPGQIYLAVPDASRSWVAGSFVMEPAAERSKPPAR